MTFAITLCSKILFLHQIYKMHFHFLLLAVKYLKKQINLNTWVVCVRVWPLFIMDVKTSQELKPMRLKFPRLGSVVTFLVTISRGDCFDPPQNLLGSSTHWLGIWAVKLKCGLNTTGQPIKLIKIVHSNVYRILTTAFITPITCSG